MHVAIVGGGFTGLSAAWELVNAGHSATVIESDRSVGGLAGGFPGPHASTLEKFYHHWFASDAHITALVEELGLQDRLVIRQSATGMYYRDSIFRLSRPSDVLRFSPLSTIDRFRLGWLVVEARLTRDWHALEDLTAAQWLRRICGNEVYRVVWEPLLRGKFGEYADEIGAVWLWNKLRLRGASRDRNGNEMLRYFSGGFAALSAQLQRQIVDRGGTVRTGVEATRVAVEAGRASGVETTAGFIAADAVLLTPALPIVARLTRGMLTDEESRSMARIRYLANVCLVLRLDRSLSSLYWINVNDTSFPFVGVIEHTNFEPPDSYGNEHIVYLSRYLPASDPAYALSDEAYAGYALPHLQRMFPQFDRSWIKGYHVWRADFAQPVVERGYSRYVPTLRTSIENLFVCTMAQVYPEDRGTNYAVRDGRAAARTIATASSRRG